MGHKTIVVFNNDHLDLIKESPEQFAEGLTAAILSAIRGEQSVTIRGTYCTATVATVVHQCHSSSSPKLQFFDFSTAKLS